MGSRNPKERTMNGSVKQAVSKEAIKQIFTEARSHHAWTDRKVSDDTLRELYELTKWGPTAVNANPVRITFIRTEEAKEKLVPALMGSNVEQVRKAPVTAIVALDEKFFTHLGELFPAYPGATELFANDPKMAEEAAFRNSTLQGAYLIMAARALGLDVCPMSGFDAGKVNEAFFAGSTWKANFIATLGYGDDSKLYPRGPRLSFEQVVKLA